MRCWRTGDATWLATERDKLAYFTLTHRIPRQDLPSLTFRAEDAETVRYFPDKLPIGLDPDGRTHVFLFLLVQDLPVDFRAFLERHAELLRALPAWTVRLLVPAHVRRDRAYEAAFQEQLASPLRPIVVEDLRWSFRARRRRPADAEERFDQAVRAFGAPRFQALYRAWMERGDPVLGATQSTTLADAIARARADWNAMSCRTGIASLTPWLARRDGGSRDEEGEERPGVFSAHPSGCDILMEACP